jgi:H+-translocating NAD(P) transhydrogenase subunit alpha
MFVGVPKEILVGEKRVALVPESLPRLLGVSVRIEHEAGASAGIPDSAYV